MDISNKQRFDSRSSCFHPCAKGISYGNKLIWWKHSLIQLRYSAGFSPCFPICLIWFLKFYYTQNNNWYKVAILFISFSRCLSIKLLYHLLFFIIAPKISYSQEIISANHYRLLFIYFLRIALCIVWLHMTNNICNIICQSINKVTSICYVTLF